MGFPDISEEREREGTVRLRGMLGVLALVVLAACGQGGDTDGDGEDGAAGETFTFVASEVDWQDAPSEVPAGTEVTFELDNQDEQRHTLVIEELDDKKVAEAEGGETGSGTVELEAGEYTYYCDVPGHREAGMEGTLTAG